MLRAQDPKIKAPSSFQNQHLCTMAALLRAVPWPNGLFVVCGAHKKMTGKNHFPLVTAREPYLAGLLKVLASCCVVMSDHA